jgi:hypothetical protein
MSEKDEEPSASGAQGGPMAMAKKMMAQMGQVGGRMEMMQKNDGADESGISSRRMA